MKRSSACLLLCVAAAGCSTEAPALDREWSEPMTGLEFVLLPVGSFAMGTPLSEFGREPQEELHQVSLTRPIYLARYEVTQAQWLEVMGGNPSAFPECGSDCPVETVSYLDIERFLARLEEQGGPRLRLPTEAEWEYACRAGSATPFAWGDTLTTDQANFDGSAPYPGAPPGPIPTAPMPVGTYQPNAWGLYDMHGNLWEWTLDRHCPYEGSAVDPLGECAGELMVIRGGSWYYGPDSARCGLRYTHRPQDDGPSLGFRLVRDIERAGWRR